MRSCYHKECDSGSNPNLRKPEGLKFLAKTAQAVVLSVAELSGGIDSCDLSKIYSNDISVEKSSDISIDGISDVGTELFKTDGPILLDTPVSEPKDKFSDDVDQLKNEEKEGNDEIPAENLLQLLLINYLSKSPRSIWSKKNPEVKMPTFERPIENDDSSAAVDHQVTT